MRFFLPLIPRGSASGLFIAGGRIEESHSISNVIGQGSVSGGIGGLVGVNGGKITKSYAKGEVTGKVKIGGLVGYHLNDDIKFSYAIGEVEGTQKVGGLVGVSSAKINTAYSNGKIKGQEIVGGLVGLNRDEGSISESFTVSSNVQGTTDIGGLVGTNGADISSSYWNIQASNQTTAVGRGNSDGMIGLTTSEMTGTTAETNMPDFDWTEIWVTTDSYPALFWE